MPMKVYRMIHQSVFTVSCFPNSLRAMFYLYWSRTQRDGPVAYGVSSKTNRQRTVNKIFQVSARWLVLKDETIGLGFWINKKKTVFFIFNVYWS